MPRFLVWLAAAVALLVAAGPAYARSSVGGKGFPSLAPMKWAQDSTKIFLTVSLGCKRDVKFKPTRDTFALSCTDAAGVVQTTTMLGPLLSREWMVMGGGVAAAALMYWNMSATKGTNLVRAQSEPLSNERLRRRCEAEEASCEACRVSC